MSNKNPRFPDIDWWCDNCGSYLNNQPGFDDHKYLWKCKNCGYKNSLSWDNVFSDRPVVSILSRILLYCGIANIYFLIASILVHFSLLLPIESRLLAFWRILQAPLFRFGILPFFVSYIVLVILGMLFERFVAKYWPDKNAWILRSFFYYLWLWISSPFKEIFYNIGHFGRSLSRKYRLTSSRSLPLCIISTILSLVILWIFIGLISE